jgi:transcriptional regulator with XRE-family HTH domain
MSGRLSVAKRRAITEAAERIGESVSAWRRAQRLTQAELAQRAHTSVRTVAKIESGDPTITLSIVLSVAHTLGFLPEVISAFEPLRSDFGAALVAEGLPKRVRERRG